MTISELIKDLQEQMDKHGDLEVMLNFEMENYISVSGALYEESTGNFPDEWEMPEGFKFVSIL